MLDRLMDGWWRDGWWMNGQMEGWMDVLMDAWIGR